MNVELYETRLKARRVELSKRLHTIEHDLDQPMNADAEERAVEREGDEVLETLGNAGLTELKSIEAALDRIANGSYGTCVQCREAISDERLDIVPATPICRVCANKAN